MSWISHVKAYQAEHPKLSYGEAMKAAKSTYKKSSKKKGKGVIDNVKKALKYVKEKIFFPANKLPGSAQKAYDKLKGATVKSIMVNRKPVNSMVEKALNLMSLGTYEKEKKKLGYDKMFHLSMVLNTNQGRIAVEKNERINIASGGTGGGESIDIAYDRADTFASFLEKARRKMGDHKFFQYNAFENNCQDFILGLLSANGVLSAESKKFIKQDAESLLKAMPGFVGKAAQAATDAAGKISEITSGQGKRMAGGNSLLFLLQKLAQLDSQLGDNYYPYEVLRVVAQIKKHRDVLGDPNGLARIQPYIKDAEKRAKHIIENEDPRAQRENQPGNGRKKRIVKKKKVC